MEREFGWSEATDGLVLSAFFAGYTCTQLVGGWAATRYGGKVVLSFAVLCWSICTALTPAAAYVGLPVLVACRFLLGIGCVVRLSAP